MKKFLLPLFIFTSSFTFSGDQGSYLSEEEKLEMQKEYYLKLDRMQTTTSEELSSTQRKQELLKEETSLLEDQLETSKKISDHKQEYIEALQAEIEKLEAQKTSGKPKKPD